MAATDAETLLAGANCYNNLSAQSWLMKLGLLRLIVLNGNPMADTSPQALLSSANCFNCYGPGVWPLLELALLQLIVTSGGGGGGGNAQLVTYTSGTPAAPANPADPAIAYDPTGNLPILVWNTANSTWN